LELFHGIWKLDRFAVRPFISFTARPFALLTEGPLVTLAEGSMSLSAVGGLSGAAGLTTQWSNRRSRSLNITPHPRPYTPR
jgi:hypothetical protein